MGRQSVLAVPDTSCLGLLGFEDSIWINAGVGCGLPGRYVSDSQRWSGTHGRGSTSVTLNHQNHTPLTLGGSDSMGPDVN